MDKDKAKFCTVRDVIHDKSNISYHRKNGFSLPIHIYQILACVIGVYSITSCWTILFPSINDVNRVISVLITLLFVIVVLLFIFVSFVDPIDGCSRNVLYSDDSKTFTSVRTDNVDLELSIVNNKKGYCDVCKFVDSSSKHCNICNKCVMGFDHHCVWVNNCIGKSNYKLFLSLIIVASLFVTSITALCIHIIINNQLYGTPLTLWNEYYGYETNIPFYTLLYSFFVVNCIDLVFLWQILILHLYLTWKGITTYEYYIQRYKNLVDSEEEERGITCRRIFIDCLIIDRKKVRRKRELKRQNQQNLPILN